MGYMMSRNMRGETKYDVLVDWILIYFNISVVISLREIDNPLNIFRCDISLWKEMFLNPLRGRSKMIYFTNTTVIYRMT